MQNSHPRYGMGSGQPPTPRTGSIRLMNPSQQQQHSSYFHQHQQQPPNYVGAKTFMGTGPMRLHAPTPATTAASIPPAAAHSFVSRPTAVVEPPPTTAAVAVDARLMATSSPLPSWSSLGQPTSLPLSPTNRSDTTANSLVSTSAMQSVGGHRLTATGTNHPPPPPAPLATSPSNSLSAPPTPSRTKVTISPSSSSSALARSNSYLTRQHSLTFNRSSTDDLTGILRTAQEDAVLTAPHTPRDVQLPHERSVQFAGVTVSSAASTPKRGAQPPSVNDNNSAQAASVADSRNAFLDLLKQRKEQESRLVRSSSSLAETATQLQQPATPTRSQPPSQPTTADTTLPGRSSLAFIPRQHATTTNSASATTTIQLSPQQQQEQQQQVHLVDSIEGHRHMLPGTTTTTPILSIPSQSHPLSTEQLEAEKKTFADLCTERGRAALELMLGGGDVEPQQQQRAAHEDLPLLLAHTRRPSRTTASVPGTTSPSTRLSLSVETTMEPADDDEDPPSAMVLAKEDTLGSPVPERATHSHTRSNSGASTGLHDVTSDTSNPALLVKRNSLTRDNRIFRIEDDDDDDDGAHAVVHSHVDPFTTTTTTTVSAHPKVLKATGIDTSDLLQPAATTTTAASSQCSVEVTLDDQLANAVAHQLGVSPQPPTISTTKQLQDHPNVNNTTQHQKQQTAQDVEQLGAAVARERVFRGRSCFYCHRCGFQLQGLSHECLEMLMFCPSCGKK